MFQISDAKRCYLTHVAESLYRHIMDLHFSQLLKPLKLSEKQDKWERGWRVLFFYVSSVACPQNINIHQCVHRQRKLIIISQKHGRSTGINWIFELIFSLSRLSEQLYITCIALDWMRSRGVSNQTTYKDKQTHILCPFFVFNPCTSCHSLCSKFCFNSSITTVLIPHPCFQRLWSV